MKKLTALILILLTLFTCGCARRVYEPNEPVAQWTLNVKPDPEDKIILAWDMQPTGAVCALPDGVNVIAPTWIYAEADPNGKPYPSVITGEHKAYVADAHAKGADVWVTVCGFDADLSAQLMTEKSLQRKFCRKVVNFVQQNDIDGVCMDFEYMDPANAALYTEFVKALADMLPADKPISACVTVQLADPTGNWYQCYDHASLASVCDYICLMAYDQYHTTSESAGPVAGLDWVEEKIQMELCDVPSDKIILGMPFYYYAYPHSGSTPLWPDTNVSLFTWTILKALDETGSYTDRHGDTITPTFSVDEIDEKSGMRLLKFTDQYGITRILYADTEESLTARCSLTRIYHLAGAGVWKADYGTPEQWQLLRRQVDK